MHPKPILRCVLPGVVVTLCVGLTLAADDLLIDFNSTTQDGGPHHQTGYQPFNAGHEVAADFLAARSYSAFGTTVTLRAIWPDTTSNRVQQMIDRGPSNDANWLGQKVDLLTDWIGVDTRTGEGGRGNYDGVNGLPTRLVLRFAGLPPGPYSYRSYHHDTEHMNAPFLAEISTNGGETFEMLEGPFRITNSTAGGTPPPLQRYTGAGGQDPATLPSTLNLEFQSIAGQDVLVRYTPLSESAGVHRQFMVVNGVEIRSLVPPDAPTDLAFSATTVSRVAAEGSQVGTFSTIDPTPDDTFTYTLVDGEGADDNAMFVIEDGTLIVDRQLAELEPGNNLSIRVRSTDAKGNWIEVVFPLQVISDSNGNGLDDEWEALYFAGLPTQSAQDDPDGDGFSHAEEYLAGTHPLVADTDHDGISDGDEVNVSLTDPLNPDSDGDGLSDGDEINLYLTNPLEPDSDGDGYADGVEIAENTDPTNPASFPAFLLNLRINEILASNSSGLRDGHGSREDWLEIHNPNPQPVNLAGYRLTDNSSNLSKWVFPAVTIPAQGYLLVFASGNDAPDPNGNLHTNFSLSAGGEYLALVGPDGEVEVEFSPMFPQQFSDISYGRSSLDGSLRYFSPPTPGAANGNGYEGVVDPPVFSVERGLYDNSFELELSCPTPGAEIRYTLDSSKPGVGIGSLYTGAPISIQTTRQVRAISYRPGWLSQPVQTHSYVFVDHVAQQPANPSGWPDNWGFDSELGRIIPSDYEMDPRVVNNTLPGYGVRDALLDLPSVSINLPMDDFINPPTGIYSQPLRRIEKECSMEYILPDGSPGFQLDCKVEMHGNSSRRPARMQKHSMRLTFTSQYGPAKLRYPLFPDSPVEVFNKLVLRACFTDSWALASWDAARYRPNDSQYLRDVWMKRSYGAMGQPSSHGRYVHLYVNGLYFGMHDLTERLDADFFADHLGGEKEHWEVNADFSTGSPRWTEMMNIANSADIANPSGYAAIKPYIDLENFADYMLLHFYADSEDWPSHNGYAAANPVSGDGRFRFFVWDQEIALDKFSWNRYNSSPGVRTAGTLFQRLRLNPEFRLLLADRVQRHLFGDGAISLQNSADRYLRLASLIDKAIVAESARWGDVPVKTPYGSTVQQPVPLDNRDHDAFPPAPHADSPGGIYFTREDSWVVERDNIVNHHLPIIHSTTDSRGLIQELRANNLFPAHDAPVFSHPAGLLPPPEALAMDAPLGVIYFTVDGSDPRHSTTDQPSASSAIYSSPFVIPAAIVVKARARLANGAWSALTEAAYQPAPIVPEFLPGDSGLWAVDGNWSHPPFPDGKHAAAIVFAPTTGDRNIDIDRPITLSEITFDHGDSPFRNRIRGLTSGAPLTFEADDDGARIRVTGIGSGWAEFDMVSDIRLASDLTLAVDNPQGSAEFGALRLRGNWTGSGGIVKTGPGMASLTGDAKQFTGAVVVREGVLQVTEPATPTAASAVFVEQGGQLRLSSGGDFANPRSYTFGGIVSLASTGGSGGSDGGLRYDPGIGENRAIITNSMTIESPSGIHVEGSGNRLELVGPLVGSSLVKTGEGTLALEGASPQFGEIVEVQQGKLELNGQFGGDINLAETGVLSGTGSLGNLSGTGVVAPGAGFLRVNQVAAGLHARFRFTPSGNATLAATSLAGPFASIRIYLDGQPPQAGDRYQGGIVLPSGSNWSTVTGDSPIEIFVPDPHGSHAFEGGLWSLLNENRVAVVPTVVDLGAGPVAMETLEVEVRGAGAVRFAAWQAENFTPAELADPSISGPNAAPFGDGIANLLRFALGSSDGPMFPLLPELLRRGDSVVFRFRGNLDLTGVIYRVEVSDDPGNWIGAALLYDSASEPAPPAAADGWLEISEPVALPGPRFYRLHIALE